MTLLQQLDSIFSLANGLLFALVIVVVLCIYVLVKERKGLEVVAASTGTVFVAETNDDDNWYREEAEAHYANEIVECSGMCLCENLYVFTTTESASHDHEFCTMIACSHCPVCNPEGLVDVAEDTAPALTVVSEVQEGERVTFTFDDGSTAVMRAYTFNGCTTRQLDAPCEGGYRVDSIQQSRAIDAFTGTDCIPF